MKQQTSVVLPHVAGSLTSNHDLQHKILDYLDISVYYITTFVIKYFLVPVFHWNNKSNKIKVNIVHCIFYLLGSTWIFYFIIHSIHFQRPIQCIDFIIVFLLIIYILYHVTYIHNYNYFHQSNQMQMQQNSMDHHNKIKKVCCFSFPCQSCLNINTNLSISTANSMKSTIATGSQNTSRKSDNSMLVMVATNSESVEVPNDGNINNNKNNNSKNNKNKNNTTNKNLTINVNPKLSSQICNDQVLNINNFSIELCDKLMKHYLWKDKKANSKEKIFIYCIFFLCYLTFISWLFYNIYSIIYGIELLVKHGYGDGMENDNDNDDDTNYDCQNCVWVTNEGLWYLIMGIVAFLAGFFIALPTTGYATCLIFTMWYNSLNCKQLLIKLHEIEAAVVENDESTFADSHSHDHNVENINININSININNNGKDNSSGGNILYQWFDKEYKVKWNEISCGLNAKMFDFAIVAQFGYHGANIWICLTAIFDGLFDKRTAGYVPALAGIIAYSFSILMSVVICISIMYFICETTKDYQKMMIIVSKMGISKHARNNHVFWKQCCQVEKGMKVYSLKGQVYENDVSWRRVLRIAIMFLVSKIVIYLLSMDLKNWQ